MSFDIDVSCRIGRRDIHIAFRSEGAITAITGHSGAGKTSLLNMVAGLLKPDSGHIIVGDMCLFDSGTGTDVPPQERHAGYVFQDARLFPHMRVAANLRYGMKRDGRNKGYPAMFGEVVEFLGIGHLLNRWPGNLSGGEVQRVAIGRALLSRPRFLMMDEPLAALDHERRDAIMRLIERLRDHFQIPILYVSHERDEVERLASNIITME